MTEPTRGIHDAADHGGTYIWPINGQTFPRVQVITVGDLLKGKRPQVPTLIPPYVAAVKSAPDSVQLGFDDLRM
jgi:hypothetical protein